MRFSLPVLASFLAESNAIEGIDISWEKYLLSLKKKATKKILDTYHLDDRAHVLNSVAAWTYVRDHSSKPPTVADVLEIHRRQMKGRLAARVVGKYRTCIVKVGNHIAPGPKMLPELMDKWLAGFTRESALVVHREFETIHPFVDGNGRTGRLLWAWHRLLHQLPVHSFLAMFSGTDFNSKRQAYYNWLAEDQNRLSSPTIWFDPTPFYTK